MQREFTTDDLVDSGSGSGLGAGGGNSRFSKRRAQESELPAVVKLSYGEPTNSDLAGAVEARRLAGTVSSSRTLNVSLPVVMPESWARAVAETLLHDAWAAREGLELALPPSEIALDPGDVIRLAAGTPASVADTFRISEIADGAARSVRAAREDASLYAAAALPRRGRGSTGIPVSGTPEVVFYDGALLRGADRDWPGYIAAHLSPWSGGVAFYRSPSTSGFVLDTVLSTRATIGELAFDFYSGPTWRWDNGNELWVDLYAGSLASAEDIAVLGGANALAIENAAGEWEIVQFVSAELVSAGRYKLTRLLRGQRGSEHAMADPVAAGARVLVLDIALNQPALTPDEIGLPIVWRAGPQARDVTDEAYVEQTVTMSGKGRRPYAPVHLKAKWEDDGDIHLSWIRRTRVGGDSWAQTEVPLGEAEELYELEILDGVGGAVVRTVTGLGAPAWLYQVDDQTTDFGSQQTSIAFRVCQVNDVYGRGTAAEYP